MVKVAVHHLCAFLVGHSLSWFEQEAGDTLDLIDQLLWVLGPADSGEPGFVFFDLDETLITRDTCLIDGLGSTRFASCFRQC